MFRRTNGNRVTRQSVVAILSLVLSVQLVLCDTNDNSTAIPPTISESSTIKNVISEEPTTSSSSAKAKQKPAYTTGNELWDNLIRDCLKKPTFSCIQKNVYSYLDTTLNQDDVNITSRLQLTRNQIEYEIPEAQNDEENEINFEGRAAPIEEVSNALYGKGVKFMVTHNMDVKLPEIMFDGATFRITPRSIEGNGIVAKLEYIPKTEVESRSSDVGRIFKKKIKKFFKRKAVLAVIAVVVIIKIIKIKLFWLLPLLVGVGAAKKLVLKFLLFLFPALASIFKLCGWYHANHHKTNYHHHKHNINHLHTVLYDGHTHDDHGHHEIHEHGHHHEPHDHGHYHEPHGHHDLHEFGHHDLHDHGLHDLHEYKEGIKGEIKDHFLQKIPGKIQEFHDLHEYKEGVKDHFLQKIPDKFQELHDLHEYKEGFKHDVKGHFLHKIPSFKGHAAEYLHSSNVPPHLSYQPDDDWQMSGPGLGSEFISGIMDRKSYGSFKPKFADAKEIVQWGIAHPYHGVLPPSAQSNIIPPSSHSVNLNPFNRGKHRIDKYASPQKAYGLPQTGFGSSPHGSSNLPYGVPQQRISGSASQIRPNYVNAPGDKNLIKAQRQEALRIQKEQQLIAKQQSILNLQPFVSDVEPLTPKPIDPFYSPILSKLDQVFAQLGYSDENCRERLVCNMYKNPSKYSPHSNYISAELSRDSSELQRPVQSNPAVLRFYKYVQAARDGQEQRDCVSIYQPCNQVTKK